MKSSLPLIEVLVSGVSTAQGAEPPFSFSRTLSMPFMPFVGLNIELWVGGADQHLTVAEIQWTEPEEPNGDSRIVVFTKNIEISEECLARFNSDPVWQKG